MKKLPLVLIAILAMACSKEESQIEENSECPCRTVTPKGTRIEIDYRYCFTDEQREAFETSGNSESFYLQWEFENPCN